MDVTEHKQAFFMHFHLADVFVQMDLQYICQLFQGQCVEQLAQWAQRW